MQNKKSTYASQRGEWSKENSTKYSKQLSQLMEIFEDDLKEIYGAENALTKAIPKMIKNATSMELIQMLTIHLEETHKQAERLEKVFAHIENKPMANKCRTMENLIKEAESIMESCEAGDKCDEEIILTEQKVQHYEIETYGTLCFIAKILGKMEAASLLQKTYYEKKLMMKTFVKLCNQIMLKQKRS